MIRILIFVLWVVLFAAALTLLFSFRATMPLEAFGWRMDVPAGLALFAAVLFTGAVALATSVVKDLTGAPKAARARKGVAQREKGLAAVTRGLEAIAVGDGAAARREAERAAKALGAAPVARLIAAQAAQLSGDEAAAGEALALMLDAPETEFLALRGLYAKAMRDGDFDGARRYAERAFERRGGARWAFEAVFELALARNDYNAAQGALSRAAKSKAIDQGAADRGLAATHATSAYASHLAGDIDSAIADADAALKRAPGFAPAAVLSARLHAGRGEAKKAEKILGAAFALAPARAVAETFESVFADEGAAALDRLAEKNPESREAMLLSAKASLARGDAGAAARILADMLKASAEARSLFLMAEAQSALNGEAAARLWLSRAALAPRDDEPSADAFFRINADGWRRLIRDYIDHGRLAPPPLEAPPSGLAEEDLARAAALPALSAPLLAPAEMSGDLALEAEASSGDDTDTDETLNREAAAARGVS